MTFLHCMTSVLTARRDDSGVCPGKTARSRHRKLMLTGAGLLGALALNLSPIQAVAATTTAVMSVSVVVPAACSIVADALSFGTYSGTALSSSSTITATCTASTPYSIAIDAGTHAGTAGDTSTRQLVNGASSIAYDLWQDNAHATHWGNVTDTDTLAGTGNGSSQAITVYGSLAAGTVAAPGPYSDTVTATLTY